MPVTGKPAKPEIQQPSEADVMSIISRGGSVSKSISAESMTDEARVTLRIPADVLAKVDTVISSRKLKTPRNTWLCEAILEKLESESK